MKLQRQKMVYFYLMVFMTYSAQGSSACKKVRLQANDKALGIAIVSSYQSNGTGSS